MCRLRIFRGRSVPGRSRPRRPVDTWDELDTSFGKSSIAGYENEKPKLPSTVAEVSRRHLCVRRQRPDQSRGVSNLMGRRDGYDLAPLVY